MLEFIGNIFQAVTQTVTGATPQQLNAIIALAAISLAGFAIYAVLALAKDKK